tara:strand:- start:457 stop:1068 length:612 start_codon:yes stop_codon:yes gene_type:complete
MSKALLREYYALCEGGVCQDLLTEDEKKFVKEGGMILSGKLQEGDRQNGNGRIYPTGVLSREIDNYKELVKNMRALGELDHPESSIINLNNVSHIVLDIWMDGKTVMGKLKVLDTPSGKILRSLIEGGAQLGISSRGLGSVEQKSGRTMVQDDFQLICFDIVSDPSTPGAYMKVTENKIPELQEISKKEKINKLLSEIIDEKG